MIVYGKFTDILTYGKKLMVFLLLTVGVSEAWGDPTNITSLSSISSSGDYIITEDIDATGFSGIESFSGTLEAAIDPTTKMPYRIRNLSVPLFTTLTGTVKNLVIESVTISQAGQVGAIACTATGSARIYNVGILGGSVASTGTSTDNNATDCCGGLVGLLDGNSNASNAPRVVNCYSYANITGGNRVGGIVGYNNYSTNKNNLRSMVFGCMFYGDIINGSKKAPIYNGNNISNAGDNGVSNFNYFCAEASYVKNRKIDTYNCALLAEARYLQRFEFFRHLLNGHRELAAWWATGDVANKGQMLKWVLEPSQIGTTTPYPVLKIPGKYPSVVNIDAENATTQTERNKGGLLGTLTVKIEMGNGGAQYAPPTDTGAEITQPSLTLNITDKDPDHFNFNYYKVQLPYYNDVGKGNYTGNRVVTGWKITNIKGGTVGSFTRGSDATANDNGEITVAPYNFADRNCTKKDLYSESGRVFNQGAYWDVPEGVTEITIQPYWAQAVYCADNYRDIVYTTDMKTKKYVGTIAGGQFFTNSSTMEINGYNQKVYSEMTSARDAISYKNGGGVYDNAIVLVGNVHQNALSSDNKSQPYTIMSVDLDSDNEPDYSYILRFDGRCECHPVRVDFLNIPGLGMAQKSTGGTGTYNFGILSPKGWFESTNTSLFRFTQFEYENSNRTVNDPLILQGGVIEQWVSFAQKGVSHKIPYYHVGGNVWFKEFHRGTHQDKQQSTSHPPVSVTGGDFDEFYLTGLYRADFANYDDNLECYINGGRFGIVAGAAQEGAGNASTHANGNVIWQIQNADIKEFYGGGLNAVHPVEGNITTVIESGYIKQFCGGPKFGDMSPGKTVKTTATNCKFDTFFGAGYGGNSYSRFTPNNINNINGDYGTNNWNTFVNNNYKQDYRDLYKGVSVTYFTQYIPMSNNTQNVARLLIDFVSFSLATTRDVTSKLTGCTITGNFYGGGSLGKVEGPVSSTLTNCTVQGNVFGAGFSASKPTVEVMNTGGFVTAPYFDNNLGVYFDPVFPSTVTYSWEHRDENIANAANDNARTALAIDKEKHILYTNLDLSETNLGSVSGTVTLTITTTGENGKTIIGTNGNSDTGHVYGGGYASTVNNTTTPTDAKTTVNIKGNTTVYGNVFGGGNKGIVSGTTTVNIE